MCTEQGAAQRANAGETVASHFGKEDNERKATSAPPVTTNEDAISVESSVESVTPTDVPTFEQ